MPTKNPRVSITLLPEEVAVLDRYSAASGTPRATVLAELVRSAVPNLEEAADLIEMANEAPRKVRQGLVDDLSNATADAMGFLRPFDSDYRAVMNALQRELAFVSRKAKKGRSGSVPCDERGPGPDGGSSTPTY
jgi:predicted DNA-binding protein